MSPEDIARVRASFAQVMAAGHAFGLAFYQALFALDPALRPLFPTEIDGQARKLVDMLAVIVASLQSPDTLQRQLQQLGRRHRDYGVTQAHYDDVGAALLQALRRALGPQFDPALEQAWAIVYADIAEQMIAAGR